MDTRRVTLRGSTPELDKCANRWYPVRTNATNLSMTEDSEAKIHGGVTTAESGIEEIEDRIGIYRNTRYVPFQNLPPPTHTYNLGALSGPPNVFEYLTDQRL